MTTRSIANRTKTTSTTNSNAAARTANPGAPIPARGNRLTAATAGKATRDLYVGLVEVADRGAEDSVGVLVPLLTSMQ